MSIDLSQLPAPTVVETLDFEAVLAALKAAVVVRAPDLEEVLTLESEPLVKLLEVAAYREVVLRARINDAAAAVLLATAAGADLDQLAAWWGVTRYPGETDSALRIRTQSALDALSCAGPRAAYRWHAMAASTEVLDVGVDTPRAGIVRVSVLAVAGDGSADPALCSLVSAALNAEEIRPLCDTVQVIPAEILTYAVTATLHLNTGPDAQTVRAAAAAALATYTAGVHRVGKRVARSGLAAALHQPGVQWVDLVSPAADVIATVTQAPHCTAMTLTLMVESAA